MKKLLAALLVAASALPAHAALLLGSATYATANDLTVIQVGAQTYQFLDLTSTLGQSQAAALATYGGSGFTVATSVEIANLYDAFGFSYVSPNPYSPIVGDTAGEAANFVNHLGVTYSDADGDAALGTFIDASYGQSYSCIGFVVCAGDGFNGNDDISYGEAIFGTYLVRQAPSVSEPAMFGLLGMGAAGLAMSRRRRATR